MRIEYLAPTWDHRGPLGFVVNDRWRVLADPYGSTEVRGAWGEPVRLPLVWSLDDTWHKWPTLYSLKTRADVLRAIDAYETKELASELGLPTELVPTTARSTGSNHYDPRRSSSGFGWGVAAGLLLGGGPTS